MAFFPCIRFCNIAEYNQRSAQEQWRKKNIAVEEIYRRLKKMADERHEYYILALKMHAVVECKGLRMIMENPWHETNYTNFFWFSRPSIIDKDRTLRGDYFIKPTAYWFTGCIPTQGQSFTKRQESEIMRTGIRTGKNKPANKHYKIAKQSSTTGLCSEERSMIHPDYARNFICDFIIGKEQKHSQLALEL